MKMRVKFSETDSVIKVKFGEFIGMASPDEDGTYILVTSDGQEIPAVLVDELTVFDATENDIREGKTAATDGGVTLGTKIIPSYHTREGKRLVPDGTDFILPAIDYDYTKLQAIICPFDTSPDNSVLAEKVAIEDNVYNALSTDVLAEVKKDATYARVDLGITNNSGKSYIIRYFMYKEIY